MNNDNIKPIPTKLLHIWTLKMPILSNGKLYKDYE